MKKLSIATSVLLYLLGVPVLVAVAEQAAEQQPPEQESCYDCPQDSVGSYRTHR